MKAAQDLSMFIIGFLILLMVLSGSLIATEKGKAGTVDISLLNKIDESCILLRLKDPKCEHFDDIDYSINWMSEDTKVKYDVKEMTLKELCEKAFTVTGQTQEKIKENCRKKCICPESQPSTSAPSSPFPSISQPEKPQCELSEKSSDTEGVVGETDTVSLALTAINCKGCYISPYGDTNYLTYVSKSGDKVPSDSAEVSTIYKCKSVADSADLGIQVRSDVQKGVVCATADAKPSKYIKVKCYPAGTQIISMTTSEKNEIEVIFTSFTESFTKVLDCSNNDKCKKSIIRIECDDRNPVYVWTEKVNDKIEVGASDSEDIYPAIFDIDNKDKDCTVLESPSATVKGIAGESSKYICNTIKSWKDYIHSTLQVHLKITKPSACSSWKVGKV